MPHTELPLEHLPYGILLYFVVMSVPPNGLEAYGHTGLYSPSCLEFLSRNVNGILDIQQCYELMEYATIVYAISPEKL